MEKEVQVQGGDNCLKYHFENRYLSKRIEFIEEYNFVNDKINFGYFKSFILDFEITNNDWYNTLIIALADQLNIVDRKLYLKYLNYLNLKKNYLFRLSVLDYFVNNFLFYKKMYKSVDFDLVKTDRSRLIVKNQIIINNLIFFPKNRDMYIGELLESLEKTDDYRSHIRLFNYIINFELEKIINEKELKSLIGISKKKKLGRAVDLKILEFNDYLSIK
ncbi:hypothetical protein QWZ06_21515 [Chryseobacterium tructae]|uniref:Uncharacterized protein n=1 Tax=Chryseobacterium tructae TaxID=1037380 RepID=A0ABV7Y3Z5_9FLAO|nr:hypothetical protein [Chryseobacterium tructae]MDN3694662.1 hypothetical protein [Chryseobacterium tructae]